MRRNFQLFASLEDWEAEEGRRFAASQTSKLDQPDVNSLLLYYSRQTKGLLRIPGAGGFGLAAFVAEHGFAG